MAENLMTATTVTTKALRLELRIFSIQSKRNQDNIRKNHAFLGMAKKAVIRCDLQCQK